MTNPANFFMEMGSNIRKNNIKEVNAIDVVKKMEESICSLEGACKTYSHAVNKLWELQNKLNDNEGPWLQEKRRILQKQFVELSEALKLCENAILEKTAELERFRKDHPEVIACVTLPPIVQRSLRR